MGASGSLLPSSQTHSGGAAQACGDLSAEFAHFGEFGDAQALDLLFERADAGDLADVGGHAPEQQVARNIEGAGRDVARIGVGLHRFGARQFAR